MMHTTAQASAVAGQLAPWRWRDGLSGMLVGAGLFLVLLVLQPGLLTFWAQTLALWSEALALGPAGASQVTSPPSTALLLGTAASVSGLYLLAGRWHEHWQPLRVVVRALCLVQGSACVFFALVPARFPWSVQQHLSGLMQMGADFVLVMPWMLAVGWGLLNLPWRLKLLGPVAVLAYFVVWLPHQWCCTPGCCTTARRCSCRCCCCAWGRCSTAGFLSPSTPGWPA